MKKQIKLEYLFAAALVALGLTSGATVLAGKYAREPEKCEAVCQRKAEEAKENREDRWDNYVATAAAAAPYTPLAATYQNKIIPGMMAAYQAKYAEDIASANNLTFTGAQGCGNVVSEDPKCMEQQQATLTELSGFFVKKFGEGAIGNLLMWYQERYESLKFNINTMTEGNVPVIYNNGKFCTGWLGCYINVPRRSSDNTRSDNDITVPLGWTRFPSFTPSPGLTPSPVHSPTPIRTEIIFFEITNFRLQTALNGEEYYQIFKEQMAINYPNYQLNLAWAVSGANSCVASCKYAKIDDYQANQNWDELQAQSWPCGQNIDGQTTFSGEVDNQYSSAKTKPKENGIIRYTLSCQGETGSDTKHLLAVIQSLRWHEAIPIIDQ